MAVASHLWFFLAVSAAVMWGVGYAVDERVLKAGVSPGVLMLVHAILILPLYVFVAVKFGNPTSELSLLLKDKTLLLMTIVGTFALLGGNLAILYSIAGKNATLASMIEISYPLFVAFFAWLFFRDVQLNMWSLLSAFLIFSGLAVIYFKA